MTVRMWSIGVASASLLAVGCAHLPVGHHRVPQGGETITYARTACHGTCPVYTVTLGPDGQGIFTGEAHVAAMGDRRFLATPDQVRAFADRLRPYRPHGEVLMTGAPFCRQVATDLPGVDLHWQGAGGSAHLVFDAGCDGRRNARMRDALFGAADLLPIADLIGPR